MLIDHCQIIIVQYMEVCHALAYTGNLFAHFFTHMAAISVNNLS